MDIKLVRASMEDAETIWRMQIIAFAELLERYQDFDSNPGNEPLEKVQWRFTFPATYFYFIQVDGANAGAIRIIDHHNASPKKISPLFVMPEYRGKGIAQAAIREAEAIHGSENWQLGTHPPRRRQLPSVRENGLSPNRRNEGHQRPYDAGVLRKMTFFPSFPVHSPRLYLPCTMHVSVL